MATAENLASSKNRADPAGASRIEWVPIGALRLNPRNARTHSKKQIRQIAASIRSAGFLNPVIVDAADMVLAGHGRLEAARLEGLNSCAGCPVRPSHRGAKARLCDRRQQTRRTGRLNREILAIELGERHCHVASGLAVSELQP